MTTKTYYECNICEETEADMYELHWNNGHQDQHICRYCADQVVEWLGSLGLPVELTREPTETEPGVMSIDFPCPPSFGRQ